MSNLKKKKYITGLLIVFLLIAIVGLFSYGKVDKYKGLVKVKNAKLLSSVANTSAMTSKGTEELKYNLKYTLDSVTGLTSRNVVIRGVLSSDYASFKEINKTGITSALKNNGREIEINISDVPLGVEQNLDILIQVTNAPNNESIAPEIYIKEATGEETRTVGQTITVTTNSVLGIVYDENNIPVGNIELSINKDGREIRRTYTRDDGTYNFSDLETGTYQIKVEEEIYELVSGSETSESNPQNIIKVKEVDKFNIETHKYIEKLDLVINGKKESYSYKDAEKVVQAIKNAKTISGQIEYKIVVRNKGEKNTAIERVIDEPGEGLEFKESKNTGWKLEDGVIKYKPIEDSTLSPKEKREIKLVLDITNTNEIKTYINKLTTKGEIKEKVAFVVDNRVVKEVSVIEGDKVERPNLEIDDLDGWYTDKNYTNKYKFTNEVYKDLILYAKTNHDVREYTVRFIDKGQVVTTETVEEGHKVNRPSDPSKTGYTFECWNKDGSCFDFNTEVDSNIDLESSYNVITYNITYNLDGGSVNPDNKTAYTIETEAFTLNNPTKVGHTFTGWTGTGLNQKTLLVTINQGSTGNRTYTANYDINKYQLEIDPKGGIYTGDLLLEEDFGTIVNIGTPVKTGYTFLGWSLSGSGTYNNGTYTFGDGNGKLEAEYEINRYNISYDYSSCALTNEEITALNNRASYTIKDNNFSLNNPNKYGYVFEGWTGTDLSEKTINVEVDTSKVKELNYAANCRLQEFTVTFKDGDTVLGTKQVEYKKKVTPITTPEKNGYTFSKWLLNQNEYDFDTLIESDITLQADFTLNNYTITYEGITEEERTSLNNPTSYSIETSSFNLNNPENRLDEDQGGEVFVGWQEENDTTPSMSVTLPDVSNLGNKKYTAIWNEREPNVYNITYNLNGGTLETANPSTYKKSELPITLNNPTKEGYTFLGWTGSNGDTPSDVTIPTNTAGDLSYTANFRINKYQLEIDPKGGTYIGDLLVEEDYGTVVIINEPTKTGYSFTGWTLTGFGTYADGNYTFSNGNGKLEANWEVINYTITYDGITDAERTSLNNPTSYNVETTSFTLNNPENRLDIDEGGEVFVGWKETNSSTPSTSITLPDTNNLGNKTYTAIWNERQPNVYNITYNLNGGTLETANPSTYKKSELPITLNNPSKTGYTFDGWTGSNGDTPSDVTIPTNTTGDLSYTANFIINEYQLEIDPKGGTYPGELLLTEEYGTAVNISNPSKTGYTFTNWTLTGAGSFDNGIYTFGDGNGKLEADYSINTYNISYDYTSCALTNEEITALNNRTSYNVETDTFSLNNPSKYGYVFEGWTGNELSEKTMNVSVQKGSTGNRSYTANCRLQKFTVTFKDGDTVLDTKQVDYNTSVTAITTPEKNGYTFSKWLLNGVEYDFDNLVTEDITLQAEFSLNTYTINYEGITEEERTSLNNPTSYSIESTVFTLNNPEDRLDEDQGGEVFVGWQEENDTTPSMSVNLPNASSLGNKTYTAIWNHREPNTYNITYVLNGGTVETPNPTTYKKSELPITLNNPTKEGYTFIGWTGSNGETPTNVTIPTGTTGDLRYTANFRINEFNVDFYNMTSDGAYEKVNEASLVKDYNTSIDSSELPTVSLRGYTFKYWSLDKTNEYNISTPIINHLKLYAVYQKDVYPITYNLNGGTATGNPSSYSVDTTTFTLNPPTKNGYTFTGWTGSNGDTPETTVTLPESELGPKSYTANYSLNTYNITYNYTSCALTNEEITALNNKTSYTVEDTDFGLNNPSKYGYIFEGWTGTDLTQKTLNVTVETNKAKNLSYTANCSLEKYDVEFYNMESDETTYALDTTVSNVEYNTAIGSSSIPTVNLLGYTFKYWSLDKVNEFDLTTPITADTKLYAVYEIDTYNITYNLKDGIVSGNPNTYTVKDLPITLNNPTKTGYTFIGWTGSNGNTPSNVTIPVNTTGDLDYVAVYNIDEFDVEFYNMKSDGSYELDTTVEDIDYNTAIPSGDIPTVTLRGYTFDYWSLDKTNEFDLTTPITSNLKLYAMYTKDVYPITYNLDGGSLPTGITNPDSYSVDTTSFTLNNPSKTGYEFIGWTGSNGDDPLKVVTLPEEELGPKSYTANYTINKYTVTYMNGEDLFLEQTNIDYNTTTTAPSTNPTKAHNIFLKWLKSDNTEFDFTTPITEDITLYASWEEVEAPTITHTPTSWVGDKVTVTVSSTHPEYTYMYKVGNGTYQAYTEPFEVTENATVYAYSVKNTITSTETSHIINNIDKINPTIIDIDNTESTPVSLTIKVTAQDNESGLDHFIIYVDNTSVFVSDSYTSGLNDEKEFIYTITSLEQRTNYTVKVEAYDKVGNMSYDEEVFTTPAKHYVARVVGPTYDSPYDDQDESNYYETLKEALESATCQGASCVIQILDEVEETNTITNGQDVTIDLNGLQITGKQDKAFENNGTLKIIDKNENAIGKVYSTGTAIVNNGTLFIGENEDELYVDANEPIIEGSVTGINSPGELHFLDGKIIGSSATGALKGSAPITPYSYNASVDTSEGKEIATLEVIADAEARINSVYYTKAQEAVDSSKNGTYIQPSGTSEIMSQVQSKTDYKFVYDQETGKLKSNNKLVPDSFADSYIIVDLTNEANDKVISIDATISSQGQRDWGYIHVTNSTKALNYDDETGRIMLCSGSTKDNINYLLTKGKKYYIHFGYSKNASDNIGDDTFTIDSIKLSDYILDDENDYADYLLSDDTFHFYKNADGYYENNIASTPGNTEMFANKTIHSYLKFDLTNETEEKILFVDMKKSATNGNVSYVTVTNTKDMPAYDQTEGRQVYITTFDPRQTYEIRLTPGEINYVHFCDKKNNYYIYQFIIYSIRLQDEIQKDHLNSDVTQNGTYYMYEANEAVYQWKDLTDNYVVINKNPNWNDINGSIDYGVNDRYTYILPNTDIDYSDGETVELEFSTTSNNSQYSLYNGSNRQKISIHKYGSTLIVSTTISNVFQLPTDFYDGNKHKIKVSYDGTEYKVYFDNQPLTKLTATNNTGYDSYMYIGKRGPYGPNYFNGSIYSLKVYNRAALDDELAGTMSSTGLVLNLDASDHVKTYSTTAFINNNQYIGNTTADSYMIFDLTNHPTNKTILVNCEISSELNKDIGYIYVNNNANTQAYNNNSNRYVYISGDVAAQDYPITLTGGKANYVHFAYYKSNDDVNSGTDTFKINNIRYYDDATSTVPTYVFSNTSTTQPVPPIIDINQQVDTVQLLRNVTQSSPLEITETRDVVLDLNGHTLTTSKTEYVISNEGNLKIIDSDFDNQNQAAAQKYMNEQTAFTNEYITKNQEKTAYYNELQEEYDEEYNQAISTVEQERENFIDTYLDYMNSGEYHGNLNYDYSYTGNESVFTAPYDGEYILEAWGAQGGSTGIYKGGYGGYSTGKITLHAGDKLYINVGGSGQSDCKNRDICSGGYNGGGDSRAWLSDTSNTTSGGGGATSIATSSGLLADFESDLTNLIMVAGAGGGSYYHDNGAAYSTNGGSGGGFVGTVSAHPSNSYADAGVGTQNSAGAAGYRGGAGSFGTGGVGQNGSSGGGAGLYGGGSAGHGSTAGGSGYIGNSLLSDKKMVIYSTNSTDASTDPSTKTEITQDYSPIATSNYAKSGAGFVRISYDNSNVHTYTREEAKQAIQSYAVNYTYNGNYQEFVAPITGKYKIETWGAQGGTETGSNKAGYAGGTITLTKGDKLYVYVGQQGDKTSSSIFNGGGLGGYTTTDSTIRGNSGGGATDIRLVSGDWNNAQSLASRIMVAAGSGGGTISLYENAGDKSIGGGLTGGSGGYYSGHGAGGQNGQGGTQTSGGAAGVNHFDASGDNYPGTFGTGGTAESTSYVIGSGGGGGGYYGGGSGGGTQQQGAGQGGGGGSSYVSGHLGSVAIQAEDNTNPKYNCDNGTSDIECSYHYSGKIFTDTRILSGNDFVPTYDGGSTMKGNSGNGFAKITFGVNLETVNDEYDSLIQSLNVDSYFDNNSYINYTTWVNKIENSNNPIVNGLITKEDDAVRVNGLSSNTLKIPIDNENDTIIYAMVKTNQNTGASAYNNRLFEIYSGLSWSYNTPMVYTRNNTICVDSYNRGSCAAGVTDNSYNVITMTVSRTTNMLRLYVNGTYLTQVSFSDYGNILTLAKANNNATGENGDVLFKMLAVGTNIPSDEVIKQQSSNIAEFYNTKNNSLIVKKEAKYEPNNVYTENDYIKEGLLLHLDSKNHGDSPTTWKDLSNNHYDATLNNVTYIEQLNTFSFNGSNAYAEIPNSALVVNDEETLEIMFKPNSTANRNETIYAGNINEKVSLTTHSGYIIVSSGVAYATYYLPADFYDGNIKHIAVVYKNGEYTAYYNNEPLEKRDNTGNLGRNTSTYIGKRSDGYNYSGNIYNIKVYNRALKHDEVIRNYNVDVTRYNLPREFVRRFPTLDTTSQNGKVVSTTNNSIYNAGGAHLNINEGIIEIDKEGTYCAIENHGQLTMGSRGYVNTLRKDNRGICNKINGDILSGTGTITTYSTNSIGILNESAVDTGFVGYTLNTKTSTSYGYYNLGTTDVEINQLTASGLNVDVYQSTNKKLTINDSNLSGDNYAVYADDKANNGTVYIKDSTLFSRVGMGYNSSNTMNVDNSTLRNSETKPNQALAIVNSYWGSSIGTLNIKDSKIYANAIGVDNGNVMNIEDTEITKLEDSTSREASVRTGNTTHAVMNIKDTTISNELVANYDTETNTLVQNSESGILTIDGGSITTIGKLNQGIRNHGTLTIKNEFEMSEGFKYGIHSYYEYSNFNHVPYKIILGENDSDVSDTYPLIKGAESAIYADQKTDTEFYDGKLIGKDDIALDSKVSSVPTNYDLNSDISNSIQTVTLKRNDSTLEQDAVARIGSTKYASLKAAIDAVPENNAETEIVIIKDIDTVIPITTKSTQNIKIDYNGHFVNSYTDDVFITSNGPLTLEDNGSNKKESKSYSKSYIYANDNYEHNDVKLSLLYTNLHDLLNLNGTNSTINSGVLKSKGTIINNISNLVINDGDFITTNVVNDYNNLINNTTGTVTVEGGYFDQTAGKAIFYNENNLTIHDGTYICRSGSSRAETIVVTNTSTGDVTIDGGYFDSSLAKGTIPGQYGTLIDNEGTAIIKDITPKYFGLFKTNKGSGDLTFDNVTTNNLRYDSNNSGSATLTIKDSTLEGNKLTISENGTLTVDHSNLKSNESIKGSGNGVSIYVKNSSEIAYNSNGYAINVDGLNNGHLLLEIENSTVKNVDGYNNTPATIYTPGNSTINIKSGTIKNTGTGKYAISTSGVNNTINLGVEGGTPSTVDPLIEGDGTGIYNPDKKTIINFYDGKVIGTTAINGTVATTEEGYDVILDEVAGKEHKYLDQLPAIKNLTTGGEFDDIQTAIDQASDGDTLQVQRELTIFNNTPVITNTKTLIFDLNGKKIINNNSIFMNNEGILQVDDSKATHDSDGIYNGTGGFENTGDLIFNNTGTLTIDEGNFHSFDKKFIVNTGLLTINNGHFQTNPDALLTVEANIIENNVDNVNNQSGEVFITGGYFYTNGVYSAIVKNEYETTITGGTYRLRGYNHNGYHTGFSSVINNTLATSTCEISGGSFPYYNGQSANLVDNNGTATIKNINTVLSKFARNNAGATLNVKDVSVGDASVSSWAIQNSAFFENSGTINIDGLTYTNVNEGRILNQNTGYVYIKNSNISSRATIINPKASSSVIIEDSTISADAGTPIDMEDSSDVTIRQTAPDKTMLVETTVSSSTNTARAIYYRSRGRLTIESGNIYALNVPYAIYIEKNPLESTTGTNQVNLGTKDSNANETPVIKSSTRAINYTPTRNWYKNNLVNFYDGKLISSEGLYERFNDVETGYTIQSKINSDNKVETYLGHEYIAKTNTASYYTLQSAFANAGTTDTVQLLKDTHIADSDGVITNLSTNNVKLDLNGHTLYLGKSGGIVNEGTLEIIDSTNDKNGNIYFTNEDGIINNGTLTFTNGLMSTDKALYKLITNNGTFDIDGGTIRVQLPADEKYVIINTGTLTLTSGKIETINTRCSYGDSAYAETYQVHNTGTFNINGGYINKQDRGSIVINEGTINMTGGSINDSLPTACQYGAFFNNKLSTSTLSITGGTIGTALNRVGKPLVENVGTVTVEDISYYSNSYVRGINNKNTGTVTLTNVTFDISGIENAGILIINNSTLFNDDTARDLVLLSSYRGEINITGSTLSNKRNNVINITNGSDPIIVNIDTSNILFNSTNSEHVYDAIDYSKGSNANISQLNIKSGTVSSTTGIGIDIASVTKNLELNIGESGGTPSLVNPTVSGKTYGLNNFSSYVDIYFYDGVIKGQTGSIYGLITDTAAGYKEKRDNVTDPNTGVTTVESTLTVVGTSERVAVVNNVNFLSLQSAVNYASNNGYPSVSLYKSVELTSDLVLPAGGSNINIYLGSFIINAGTYTIDSGITMINGTDPGANISRFLASITGTEINPKNIVIFEMGDGSKLSASTIYKLYKVIDGEDKLVKVNENKIGDYDLGTKTEDLRTTRSRIYINGIGEGTYKLVGSDSKELNFTITYDSVSNNIRVNNRVQANRSVSTFATLILQLQTGMVRNPYILIMMILVVGILGFVAYQKYKKED